MSLSIHSGLTYVFAFGFVGSILCFFVTFLFCHIVFLFRVYAINEQLVPHILVWGSSFLLSHPASPAPPALISHATHHTPLITHHSSHTTHLTPLITHTTHHTRLITHHSSHTTHHTPLITRDSSHTTHHTPLITHTHHTHHSSLTPLISHTTHLSHHSSLTPLISHTTHLSHHSSHITHQLPLTTHHSSHTTYLTPLILHYSSHTTHHTPLITHHSSDTTDSLTPLPLEGLVVALSALVGSGRLWSPAALSYCKLQ